MTAGPGRASLTSLPFRLRIAVVLVVPALVATLGLRDLTMMVRDWGGPIGMSVALDNSPLESHYDPRAS